MPCLNKPGPVRTGLENLTASPPDSLKGKRLGLLANPASVDSGFNHASVLIDRLFPGRLTVLFSPQHGFHAEKQDNMVESGHLKHPVLNIPVFSLYSQSRKPTAEMFDLMDILIVDLQDAGTRVYTFIYTVSYCLELAARMNKPVIILDRPNPLGGTQTEGNLLDPSCASFVGLYPVPMRYGLTMGEIAAFMNDTAGMGCKVTTIPMTGYKRGMYFHDTGLPWIAPSPNLPACQSAYVYPGQVIFEGTNLSEGRGTTMPFEQFGAPFLDQGIIENETEKQIKGAVLRRVCFEPTSGKFANHPCHGFFIHITDLNVYKPYYASLVLLQAVMKHFKTDFQYKNPPYEYVYDKLPMDLIIGSEQVRQQLEAMRPVREIEKEWQPALKDFREHAGKFFLYEQ